ncbi:MAG: hypothetical protein M1130_00925 [Actinobacteria bacterium]|nr:hypothetical protein [Actinomycetota bacterium]
MAIKNYHREREMYAEMKKAIVIAMGVLQRFQGRAPLLLRRSGPFR